MPPMSRQIEENAEKRKQEENENDEIDLDPTQDRQRYIAEVLHILRPLCHCWFP